MNRLNAIRALLPKEEEGLGSFYALRCKDFVAALSLSDKEEAELLGVVAGTDTEPGVTVEFSWDTGSSSILFRYVGFAPVTPPSTVIALCLWLEGEI